MTSAIRMMRMFSTLKFRSFFGALYRNYKRNKGRALTESAEVLASALRTSLRTNGYGRAVSELDEYDVLLLCKSHDFYIVENNIAHIIQHPNLQFRKIHVIVDQDSKSLTKICNSHGWKQVEVIEESKYEAEISNLEKFINLYNPSRRSWIRQQCFKTIFVALSDIPVLIIDSDTFIKSDYNPISNGIQELFAGNDFHYPYSSHIKKFLRLKPIGLSFVHHVQLQQPSIIHQIYGENFIDGLQNWLKTGVSIAEYSPISEFQTYGDFLLQRYPEKVRLNFHIHHLWDARDFKLNLESGLENALGPHYSKCDCDFVTLSNKHLIQS